MRNCCFKRYLIVAVPPSIIPYPGLQTSRMVPPMPRPDTQKPGREKDTSRNLPTPNQDKESLVLYGDIAEYKYAFVSSQKKLISLSVRDSILVRLQAYPGGVTRFFEDAITEFSGDLRALIEASIKFVDERRTLALDDPARNASVRVHPSTYEKVQKIHAALHEIRGMSRAKVIAGLVNLKLYNQ